MNISVVCTLSLRFEHILHTIFSIFYIDYMFEEENWARYNQTRMVETLKLFVCECVLCLLSV